MDADRPRRSEVSLPNLTENRNIRGGRAAIGLFPAVRRIFLHT